MEFLIALQMAEASAIDTAMHWVAFNTGKDHVRCFFSKHVLWHIWNRIQEKKEWLYDLCLPELNRWSHHVENPRNDLLC